MLHSKKQPINRYWEDSARLLASVKLDYRATDDAIMLRILDKGIIQLSCRDDETWQKKRFSFTPEKTVQVLNLLQSFFPLKNQGKLNLCVIQNGHQCWNSITKNFQYIVSWIHSPRIC